MLKNKVSPLRLSGVIVTAGLAASLVGCGGGGGSSSSVPSGQGTVSTLTGTGQGGAVNGPLNVASFNQPSFIAHDSNGNLFVSDSLNESIRRISAAGTVSTVAGGVTASFVDGTGDIAKFSQPAGIAVTPDGSVIYVADFANNRIRRIALTAAADPTVPANWTVSTVAGTGTATTFTSATGAVATLNRPTGLALSPGGDLYTTEQFTDNVRLIHLTSGDPTVAANWQVSLFAGSTTGVTGDIDGIGAAARFDHPIGVAVGSTGVVYVADALNQRIRVIQTDGTTTTLAGGVSGDVPHTGYVNGLPAIARFSNPLDVAVNSIGTVYVADTNNHRIRQITSNGTVSLVAGSGVVGEANGTGAAATFDLPEGITLNTDGKLVVTDPGADIIRSIILSP